MTTFYTVIGFRPEPFATMTDGGHGYSPRSNRIHSYHTLGNARSFQTRMQKRYPALTFRVYGVSIEDSGFPTSWREQ